MINFRKDIVFCNVLVACKSGRSRNLRCTSSRAWPSWTTTASGSWPSTTTGPCCRPPRSRRLSRRASSARPTGPTPRSSPWTVWPASTAATWTSSSTWWAAVRRIRWDGTRGEVLSVVTCPDRWPERSSWSAVDFDQRAELPVRGHQPDPAQERREAGPARQPGHRHAGPGRDLRQRVSPSEFPSSFLMCQFSNGCFI